MKIVSSIVPVALLFVYHPIHYPSRNINIPQQVPPAVVSTVPSNITKPAPMATMSVTSESPVVDTYEQMSPRHYATPGSKSAMTQVNHVMFLISRKVPEDRSIHKYHEFSSCFWSFNTDWINLHVKFQFPTFRSHRSPVLEKWKLSRLANPRRRRCRRRHLLRKSTCRPLPCRWPLRWRRRLRRTTRAWQVVGRRYILRSGLSRPLKRDWTKESTSKQ